MTRPDPGRVVRASRERWTRAGSVAVDRAGTPRFRSPLHDDALASWLGAALGLGFAVCFATGLLSHLAQDPPAWFSWPARPAGLYRVTQGIHVTVGLALIPLLFAKLWVVYPKLFAWPLARSGAEAMHRLLLLPLIGGAILLVVTGLGNIHLYRPWPFPFRAGHLAAAWITVGALVVHATAQARTTWRHRPRRRPASEAATPTPASPSGAPTPAPRSSAGLDRRGFVTTVFATSAAAVLLTVGQTYAPLRRLALLAPRRPDVGPQGFPVNRTAASVGLTSVDLERWRLRIDGSGVDGPLELDYHQLRALPRRTTTLPIACVEGWSTTQTWTGVPVRDLVALAGAHDPAGVTVRAMHRSARQRSSELDRAQLDDRDTLLALEVNGEPLHPDHGFPARLIGPNRPGVAQTKWVDHLEVHR